MLNKFYDLVYFFTLTLYCVCVHVNMPPPSSKAWSFFKRNADSKIVKCKLCEMELVYTGGTSNMLNHLKLKHPNDFSETPEKVKQSSVLDFVQTPRSRRFSSTQSELITNSIVDMIILDYLPIRIVEGKGFSKLMSIIAPEFKIPSRNTIKSRIEKSYSDKKESLIKELNLIDSVSLTSDTWTSNATKSFLTVQNITLTKTGIYSQMCLLLVKCLNAIQAKILLND